MGRRLGVLLCSLLVVTGCLQVGLATLASAASSWSVIPVSVSAYSSSLGDISCAGSSFCVATGWALGKEANALYHPLIERWNGSSWSPMQSPASELNVHLGAVSCTSPIFCMLVGYSQARNETVTPLTEQWNGKRWKIVPNAAEGMFADSISCIGSSFCAVVGTYEVAGEMFEDFGEVWDGNSWTATPTPNLGSSGLNGVRCVTATSCEAVGFATVGSPGHTTSFALDWNGSMWTQFPSQNGPDSAGYNSFTAVTCRKTLSSCVAVGVDTPSETDIDQTLIESWTPTGWTIAPSPHAPGGNSDPWSVSCPRAIRCVTVGSSKNGTGELIEELDGSTWTVSPGADEPGSALDVLGGIACTHKTCFAAGTWATTVGQQPQRALLITSNIG